MRYLLRRIGIYIVTAWAAITINFLIPRMMPGDPVEILAARLQGKLAPQAIHSLEIALGVSHASMWDQYLQYIGDLFHGNLGLSVTYFPTPVTTIISSSLPWTVVLVGVATIISFVLGTFLGILSAWRRNSALDNLLAPIATFFYAVPYFWLALILLFMLGVGLKWFPLSGAFGLDVNPGVSFAFYTSAIYHAILPALTIVLSSMAGWLLGMRNMMVTTLSEDYIILAEAKGLSARRIMLTYAARNAILPNITGFALSLGFIVSGSLLTEIVFSYPGIGYELLQAVQNNDYPLMQGIFLIITLSVLVANFIADTFYVVLDPRVRQEG